MGFMHAISERIVFVDDMRDFLYIKQPLLIDKYLGMKILPISLILLDKFEIMFHF